MNTTTEIESKAYLTFNLGKESFALAVDSVKEILEMSPITEVPQSPHFMRGIVNLRGNVLPVIDSRTKFGLPTAEDTLKTRIIVLDIMGQKGAIQVGAVVDKATEVINVDKEEILPPPSLEDYERAEYIEGVIKRNEEFIMVLEAQKIFGSDAIEKMENVTESL